MLMVNLFMTSSMLLSLTFDNCHILAKSELSLPLLPSYSLVENSKTGDMNITSSSGNMTLQNFNTRLSDLYNKSIKSVITITTSVDPRL
jgi:hypothetical protein